MKTRSPLLPIFLIVVVDVLGLTIILPLLPFYAESFGASPRTVGLLVSSFAVCQLVSGPLLGRLSDRTGRKPLLLVSQVGTLFGFLLIARATSLWMVFAGRVIDGLTAGNLSLAQAYISDATEPKNRARAFGLIGAAFGIGFLFGPALSGYTSQWGYHVPLYIAAALSATSILATATLLPARPPTPPGAAAADEPPPPAGRRLAILDWREYATYFRRPGLRWLLAEFFLFSLAFALFSSGFALFAERRFTWDGRPFGPKQVGYVLAYAGFLGVILQGGLIGRLVKALGERRLVFLGFVAAAVGFFALGLTWAVWQLLLVATVQSFGTGVLRPALTSLITQAVSRHEQGTILGLNQSLVSVAQIIGPAISGFLIDRALLIPWAFTIGGVCLVALLVGPLVKPGAVSK